LNVVSPELKARGISNVTYFTYIATPYNSVFGVDNTIAQEVSNYIFPTQIINGFSGM